jgi:HSP20 family protein
MLARMLNDFAPMFRLHDDVNRLFEHFFEDLPATRGLAQNFPGVNTWEDDQNGWVEAEVPGLTMQDLDVTVTDNELTISGQRQLPQHASANYQRRERGSGRFSRTLTLPWQIEADKVEAHLRDGVLNIMLPKSQASRPKKVKVLTA